MPHLPAQALVFVQHDEVDPQHGRRLRPAVRARKLDRACGGFRSLPECSLSSSSGSVRAGSRATPQWAIYACDQLREQLVWFWLNHFSVYAQKANVRWTIADYEERAIRPHVLGRFRDLVLATLTHPAMLQDLDNAQNSRGHLNENYAR